MNAESTVTALTLSFAFIALMLNYGFGQCVPNASGVFIVCNAALVIVAVLWWCTREAGSRWWLVLPRQELVATQLASLRRTRGCQRRSSLCVPW